MAVQAGEAYIPVKADMSTFGKDVETGVEKGAKGATGKAKGAGLSIAKTMGAAFVVGSAGSFVKGIVGDLGRIETLNAQTANVIESTGGKAGISAKQVGEMADEIERATGIEAELVQESQNLLLTFTNISGKDGMFERATKAATDMSVAFGQDSKSSAIQLGKALNDPIKGVTALSRVGVSFTAAQKEQIKAMVEAGDVAGAQGVILGELETQVGGSAEAFGDTFPGSVAKLQNTLGALAESVIAPLIPKLESMATWLAENEGVMKIVAITVGGVLVAAFTAWAISAAAAAAATLLAAAPIIALGVVVAGLAATIYYVWTRWDEIWEWIKTKVTDAMTSVSDFVSEKVEAIVGFFTSIPGRLADAASGMWDFIKDGFRAALNWVVDAWNDLKFPTFDIPKVSIPGLGDIGGGSIGGWKLPQIDRFHTGGVFRAPPGQREGLALLLDGERVLSPRESRAGANALTLNVYNPVPEPASETIVTAGRRAAAMLGGG